MSLKLIILIFLVVTGARDKKCNQNPGSALILQVKENHCWNTGKLSELLQKHYNKQVK